jgi:hypothetical protein
MIRRLLLILLTDRARHLLLVLFLIAIFFRGGIFVLGFLTDGDGDTLPNRIECRERVPWSIEDCVDTDEDGVKDVMDSDSDNDGLYDRNER